jgi:hypothetical protein
VDFWTATFLKINFPFIVLCLFGVVLVLDKYLIQRNRVNSESLSLVLAKLLVQIFAVSYTFMIVEVSKPFQCVRDLDGSLSMYYSPNLLCYSQRWNSNIGWVSIYLIFYSLVLPCIFVFYLWKDQRNPSTNFQSFFGVLTEPFSQKYSWWELVRLAKKTLFAIIANMLTSMLSKLTRYFLITGLIFLFFSMECVLQPFKTPEGNKINLL